MGVTIETFQRISRFQSPDHICHFRCLEDNSRMWQDIRQSNYTLFYHPVRRINTYMASVYSIANHYCAVLGWGFLGRPQENL